MTTSDRIVYGTEDLKTFERKLRTHLTSNIDVDDRRRYIACAYTSVINRNDMDDYTKIIFKLFLSLHLTRVSTRRMAENEWKKICEAGVLCKEDEYRKYFE